MFFCEFCKIFKNIFSFDRTTPDDCFLCLSVNFEKFFRTPLSQSTSRKLLFYVQVAEFQPPDAVKNYFTGAFQAFYTRSRSSHLISCEICEIFKSILFFSEHLQCLLLKVSGSQLDSNFDKKETPENMFYCEF